VAEGGEIERSEIAPGKGSASAETDLSPGFELLLETTLSYKGRG